MRRVISLWLPYLATDRLRLRQRAERRPGASRLATPLPLREGTGEGGVRQEPRPLVTAVALGGRSLVAAVDALAAAGGIAPAMPLADARALAPDLVTRPADPAGDAAALARLAEWCGRYTPLVAVEPAADPLGGPLAGSLAGPLGGAGSGGGLWLDVTGCTHLFGGEAALLADLLHRLRRFGYGARAGLADAPGAAWAAARFLDEAGGDGAVIAAGAARAVLAPLPVAALRLAPAAAAGLERLGLRRVGDLYPLPRATLARRFGEQPVRRLDQALGRLAEPISPRLQAEPHLARLAFAEPLRHREGLAAAIERLLAMLCRDLDAGQRGARQLVLTLYRVDGSLHRAGIGTSRPSRDAAALSRLFAEHLDRLDPGFGAEVMTLEATVVEPLTALQLALGRGAQLHPPPRSSPAREEGARKEGEEKAATPITPSLCGRGQGEGDAPEIAGLVDRLGNRLGFDRVTHLVPRESHVPERAVARLSVTKQAARGAWQAVAPRRRPLRLLDRPEPVEATALLPDQPPVLFRRGKALHRVARAEGPERLLPEWWHVAAPDAALPAARDYFRVEDEAGRRYWLYREMPTGAAPRWFLHGLFG